MKLCLIQHDIVWENPEANFERLAPMIEKACKKGAGLVVLAEMFSWGFSMDTEHIAEPPDGPSAGFLKKCAQDFGVWVCGTYPEKIAGSKKAFNQLLLAGPDGNTHKNAHKYAKMHPFSYAGEDKHYEAGSRALTAEICGIRLSPFICYDLRFGEDFWQLAKQTDLYILPANWPEVRQQHWVALLKARAIENQAFVAGVNRIGEGNGVLYAGKSLVFDPQGEMLAEGGSEEELLFAEIDAKAVAETREHFPFLRDRKS